jgi:hypothetical protein
MLVIGDLSSEGLTFLTVLFYHVTPIVSEKFESTSEEGSLVTSLVSAAAAFFIYS